MVIIVGTKKAVAVAVRRQDTSHRYTALPKRLQQTWFGKSTQFSKPPHFRREIAQGLRIAFRTQMPEIAGFPTIHAVGSVGEWPDL